MAPIHGRSKDDGLTGKTESVSRDKVRCAVTLTGIAFALALIIIQFGLFLGFTTTTSNNIDHSNADPGSARIGDGRGVRNA